MYGMVRVMNGFMRIESEEGRGTTVTVSMPQQVVEEDMEQPDVYKRQASSRRKHISRSMLISRKQEKPLEGMVFRVKECVGTLDDVTAAIMLHR